MCGDYGLGLTPSLNKNCVATNPRRVRTFVAGDALWLQGLRLRVIRNRGRVGTVLAVRTR